MGATMIVADLHAGRSTHDVRAEQYGEGMTTRRAELHHVLHDILAEALQRKVTAIALIGDVYDSKRPPAWAYREVQQFIERAEFHGIRVYLMPGNHDWFDGPGVSPLQASGGILVDTPMVVEMDTLDMAFVPWFGRANVAASTDKATGRTTAEQHRYMADALERIVASLAAKKREGVPLYCVSHFTVAGASYNSDVQPLLGEAGEFIAPLQAFARPEFTSVLLGHVHKPQVIAYDPCLVEYVGGCTRSDFGEETQPCRVLVVDGTARFDVPIETAQRFVTLTVDTLSDPDPFAVLPDSIQGAIVRIKGEMPAGAESVAKLREWTQALEEAGATKVAKPAVKFIRHEMREQHSMTVDQPTDQTLEQYIGIVGGEYKNRKPELLEAHVGLMAKVGAPCDQQM